MKKRFTDPVQSFLHKIHKAPSGCWEWTAYKFWHGYGYMRVGGRSIYAHRFAYDLLVGPIPSGLDVHHTCKNRGCVNPEHLTVLSRRAHLLTDETIAKTNARKTHCPQGHVYSLENTMLYRRGNTTMRSCRICCRAKNRAYYRKTHPSDLLTVSSTLEKSVGPVVPVTEIR